jgi:hypothetical protein
MAGSGDKPMLDNPDKRLAQIRAIAAKRQLLRAKDDYDRAVAQVAHQTALAELERLKGAERG